jgi:AcrR family transcriptional regulator
MTAALERRPGRPRNEQADTAILDAAIDALADYGYLGLSVEAVAERAGVAKTTVYRRWPGKDELVFDAINKLKGPIATPPGKSVREDLSYLMDAMRAQWVNSRHGQVMRRLAADGSARPELFRQFRDRLVAPRQAVLRAVLQRGVADGLIRPDVDLQWAIDMLVAPVIVAVMTHKERVSPRQVQFTVDTVLRGLAP